MPDESLLDYRDPDWLADKLGVDKSTIYRYLQDGTLPGLQLGRKWLVSERQVVEFLNEETRRQTELRRRGVQAKGGTWLPLSFRGIALGPGGDRFGKFTERARGALTLAQQEAVALGHNYVGTEHILIGLIGVGDGLAFRALTNLGIEPDSVRRAVLEMVGRGEGPVPDQLGLTAKAKKVIELAVEEARRLNHSYIGTEHLFLGLLREGEGVAFRVLSRNFEISLDAARSEVVRLLMAGEAPKS
jgi:excisionase family DNA binding protein